MFGLNSLGSLSVLIWFPRSLIVHLNIGKIFQNCDKNKILRFTEQGKLNLKLTDFPFLNSEQLSFYSCISWFMSIKQEQFSLTAEWQREMKWTFYTLFISALQKIFSHFICNSLRLYYGSSCFQERLSLFGNKDLSNVSSLQWWLGEHRWYLICMNIGDISFVCDISFACTGIVLVLRT